MELPLSYYRSRAILRGFYLFVEKLIENSGSGQNSSIHVIDIRTGKTLYSGIFGQFIDLRSITEKENYCLEFLFYKINIWDMKNHEVVASFVPDPKLPAAVAGAKICPLNKSQIALSCGESIVRIIDPPLGQFSKVIPANEPIRDILITPDGKGLLAMAGSAVKYWDLTAEQRYKEFNIPKMEFWDSLPEGAPLMTITPDGKSLLLPAQDGIAVWDISTGEKAGEFSFSSHFRVPEINGTSGPFALYMTFDGTRLMLVSGSIGFLGAYELKTGVSVSGFPLKNIGRFNAFCINGSFFAVSDRNVMLLWDVKTGSLLRKYDQGSFIEDIVFLSSQKRVVTSSRYSLYFWDCENTTLLMKKPDGSVGTGHSSFGLWLSLVPGDRQLLVHYEDCIALWDLDTHRFCWRDDSFRRSRVRKIAVFPDGKRFVVVDINGMVQIRNIKSGEVLATLIVLDQGFIWETPPDENAPSGWLWTDREDLIHVIACSKDNRHTEVLRKGDGEHRAYLKIYNNPRMVMARIAGSRFYHHQSALYASAVDKMRISSGFVSSLAALPAGDINQGD